MFFAQELKRNKYFSNPFFLNLIQDITLLQRKWPAVSGKSKSLILICVMVVITGILTEINLIIGVFWKIFFPYLPHIPIYKR